MITIELNNVWFNDIDLAFSLKYIYCQSIFLQFHNLIKQNLARLIGLFICSDDKRKLPNLF